MSKKYGTSVAALRAQPKTWLVTGAAGFIGSNLLERLLELGQSVVGMDNFATGNRGNLSDVRSRVGDIAWARLTFYEADLVDYEACRVAVSGVDYVLHQGALGSVPRSIADPLATHRANVDGFVNLLAAARVEGVRSLVYASSSSVYGDEPNLPKREERMGRVLSPYALTKLVDEQYAQLFTHVYGIKTIGLRYFNVFGRRQDPRGAYAAVIPKWVRAALRGEQCIIYGDGATSRDFCYIDNVIQANILAATAGDERAFGQLYNIAVGQQTTLLELHDMIREGLLARRPDLAFVVNQPPVFKEFRPGDVRHSLADISKASQLLGYVPTHTIADGMAEALDWYVEALAPEALEMQVE
jgi:UDP-N-acetylglucosamine/UDP-N-acetylgalactosamine 4-epimerase